MHFYIDRMVQNEFGKRKKEMCYAEKHLCKVCQNLFAKRRLQPRQTVLI